jgi:cytochrome c oxidase subunit 2
MWWLLPLAHASTFAPFPGTTIAAEVDKIYAFLLVASLISFIILIGGMAYFVTKYRRRSGNDKTAYITHNHTLEFLWSFIPFLIFMFVFAWGWMVYHDMRTPPADALEVHVFAKKWEWRFIYKNGKEAISDVDDQGNRVPATMVVPQGRPVKLIMASEKINPQGTDPQDRPVLHSFYVPAFRVKQDVVPGRYTALWFKAEEKGLFNVFCAEYCGSGHSNMLGLVKVVSPEEFDAWLAGEAVPGVAAGAAPPANPLVTQGKQIYLSKACAGCHSLNGSPGSGPTFKGLFGKTEKLQGGDSVQVDESYIRESILVPGAKTVQGFTAGTMPPFAGQLSEDELTAVIEFIKTIK